ncbi:MAG: type II and III secretion system protein [Azospira sp.]|jgi:general secretion pathway protein D|nr:type II and III secretion system protein [Azospira sp.]
MGHGSRSALFLVTLFAILSIAACSGGAIRPPGEGHLSAGSAPRTTGTPPAPVTRAQLPPPPQGGPHTETYSVEVNGVRVHDLLFALARDARLNVDIHPGIEASITLNAVGQTLPQLLERIARQADMRFELDGANLVVQPDTPFLRNYPVDYPHLSRETTASLAVATQLVGGIAPAGAAGGAAAGNNSTTRIENRAQHRFWETLVQNIKDILRETDKILPEGSSETVVEEAATQSTTGTGAPPASSATATARTGERRAAGATNLAGSPNPAVLQNTGTSIVRRSSFREAASVIAHPETGILAVRATGRQHTRIREFIDRIQEAAKRQVMIEATLVEVNLSHRFRQGVDWSRIASGGGFGLSVSGPLAAADGLFSLSYANGSFAAMIRLLENFGTTRVLSSPKLSVLNNQTAVLKVVDNSVYFTIKADTAQNQTTTVTTYTTTLNQIPVGFVMSVTPQIGESDTVLLNVRPSVSRIVGTVRDPNPALRGGLASAFSENIVSEVPVIRTREMESMLRIQDGSIAVMGGLMEDVLHDRDDSVPGLARLPFLGKAFTQRDDAREKSELVIFLRPTIIRDADLGSDYAMLHSLLPDTGFFAEAPAPAAGGER